MKKLIVCVGLAAIGTSSLRAQFNPGLSPAEMAKAWTVAATLRGFYDDNYLTIPNGSLKRGSYGVEIAPQASLNHQIDQTSYSFSDVYDLRYFGDRETTDQSETFNATLNHSFSDSDNMQVGETFIYSKEPTIIDPTISASPLRTTGDNIHNTATIGGSAELTKVLSLKLAYANNLYAYQQLAADVSPGVPSRSALLDRMEQLATVDLAWKATDQLEALLGYQYQHVDYTSPEKILFAPVVYSNERNSDSHFIFIGADDQFTSTLTGSIRAGGQYVEYDNAPTHANSTDPYVDASLTWQYMKDSDLMVGVKHQHNATDVIGAAAGNGNPVLDSEATASYVNVTQSLGPDFSGSVLGQWQHSTFNGGSVNGQSEDFMICGLNLSYRFNPYFSAETGYNWNKLVSDISGRDYTRNIVYLGVKGEY